MGCVRSRQTLVSPPPAPAFLWISPASNTMHKDELWENALATLEIEVSKANFITFFSKTKLISLDQDNAVIACSNALIAERLKQRYAEKIKEVLADLTGKIYRLTFKVHSSPSPTPKPHELGPLFAPPRCEDRLFPTYTFENFVVGLSNRLAHAAAVAVTEQSGNLHNPLLFYSGVGLGKTHLIHAIGNAIKTKDQEAKVRYCPAETFTNEMVQGIQNRQGMAQFRRRYRLLDVLLVDDIQFLAGREATQEEFFNTFNELYLSGKQVVLTSDRHPQEIKSLEARLVSRFSGGMVVDIQPPELDLRIAILKQKMRERGATLNDEVVLSLAQQVAGSIRQLEGTLSQLLLLSRTFQEATPQELLTMISSSNSLNQPQAKIPPELIFEKVCHHFEISKEELTGKRRLKETVVPRQVAMYLLRTLALLPLKEIGAISGGRDHTTVLYAIKTVEERMKSNPFFQREVATIKEVIRECGKLRPFVENSKKLPTIC